MHSRAWTMRKSSSSLKTRSTRFGRASRAMRTSADRYVSPSGRRVAALSGSYATDRKLSLFSLCIAPLAVTSTRTYGLIRISLSCAFPSRPLSFRYTNGLRTVDAPALMLLSAQRNMTDLGDVLREEAKKVVVSHRGGASAYLSYLRLRISVSCSLAYLTCYSETMEEAMTAPLSRGIGSRVLRWLSVYPLGFRSSSLLCLRPGFFTANPAVSSFLSVVSLFAWATLTYLQEEVSWEQWCARPSVPLPTQRLLIVARQDNQRRDPPAVRPRWVRAPPPHRRLSRRSICFLQFID